MVAFVDLVGAARKHERWQHALSVNSLLQSMERQLYPTGVVSAPGIMPIHAHAKLNSHAPTDTVWNQTKVSLMLVVMTLVMGTMSLAQIGKGSVDLDWGFLASRWWFWAWSPLPKHRCGCWLRQCTDSLRQCDMHKRARKTRRFRSVVALSSPSGWEFCYLLHLGPPWPS